MIVLAGLIAGAATGWLQASWRGGIVKDKAQWAFAFAVIGAIAGLFLTIVIDRLTRP